MDIHYWNNKLYRDENGNWLQDRFTAEDFSSKFGIKSWPLYKDGYACHLPPPWNKDVGELLSKIRKEYGEIVEILQVKEKWANLTIYYSVRIEDRIKHDKIYEEVNKMINKTKDILREKGLHP